MLVEEELKQLVKSMSNEQRESILSAVKITRGNIEFWSAEELELLKTNYQNCYTAEEFKEIHMPHRTVYSIRHKAKRLGLKRKPCWEKIHNFDELSNEQLCYFAGIYDGEGYLRDDGYVCLTVTNCDINLINWLISHFGGSVSKRCGRKPHHKDWYSWSLSRKENVVNLLLKVYPYLIVKHDKVEKLFLRLEVI